MYSTRIISIVKIVRYYEHFFFYVQLILNSALFHSNIAEEHHSFIRESFFFLTAFKLRVQKIFNIHSGVIWKIQFEIIEYPSMYMHVECMLYVIQFELHLLFQLFRYDSYNKNLLERAIPPISHG